MPLPYHSGFGDNTGWKPSAQADGFVPVFPGKILVKRYNLWYTPRMKKLRIALAVMACKLSRKLIRLLGRGGTDFPGRLAMKICPDLLGILAKNVTTVIVTGTNGKTTTARMIEQAVADSGISYFANKSGANLLTGILAEYAMHATLGGRCKYQAAVIECDEGAMKHVTKYIDAKAIVVSNVFRDQLDRFGEVTGTLDSIRTGVLQSPNAVLCLNADDSLCATLADGVPNRVIFFGVNVPIYQERVQELSDAPYCIHCKEPYVYDYITYGHLGGFRCPGCGYSRPTPEIAVTKVAVSDADHSEIEITADGVVYPAAVNLPGGYNIYNACSAMAVGKALGLDAAVVARSLSSFSCGFGRMEKFEIDGTAMRMILIKNPAGCNQVLNFLANLSEPSVFAICLNDKTGDGKDVSWIWDVDFERLLQMEGKIDRLIVSGMRADDMAVRLKYAGIEPERIAVCRSYDELLKTCTGQKKPVYIMPNYTAMLTLRELLSKRYGFSDYWE